MDTDQEHARYVAALRRELSAYERAGRPDRAAQVEAELARVSGTPLRGAERRPRGRHAHVETR